MSELARNPCHTSANPSRSEEVQLYIPSIVELVDTFAGCDNLLLMSVVRSVLGQSKPCSVQCLKNSISTTIYST